MCVFVYNMCEHVCIFFEDIFLTLIFSNIFFRLMFLIVLVAGHGKYKLLKAELDGWSRERLRWGGECLEKYFSESMIKLLL